MVPFLKIDISVFENRYFKFTVPEGSTVSAPEDEHLQLWDPSLNPTVDGQKIPYAEIALGRMDGDPQDVESDLKSMGFTQSRTIGGYPSMFSYDNINGEEGKYIIILGESKEQPGRTDTVEIMFDYGAVDKIDIVINSLVIKGF